MEIHLASMENITCWAFRRVCVGATDSYTGMLSMKNLVLRHNAWNEVDTYFIPGQRQWIQVNTSKEKECVDFLKRLESHLITNPAKDNVYGLQLNASCPSPEIIKIGQGSALIKRATKVTSLLRELLKQEKFKVGIKVRLGLNKMEVDKKKLIQLFCEIEKIGDPNLSNVTVHFKHAGQSSRDPYDYSMLREISGFKVPIVVNGGIRTLSDLERLRCGKNVVGLMIARGALENPDCLAEISNKINKTAFRSRSLEAAKKDFYSACAEHQPKPGHLAEIQKHCKWAR